MVRVSYASSQGLHRTPSVKKVLSRVAIDAVMIHHLLEMVVAIVDIAFDDCIGVYRT